LTADTDSFGSPPSLDWIGVPFESVSVRIRSLVCAAGEAAVHVIVKTNVALTLSYAPAGTLTVTRWSSVVGADAKGEQSLAGFIPGITSPLQVFWAFDPADVGTVRLLPAGVDAGAVAAMATAAAVTAARPSSRTKCLRSLILLCRNRGDVPATPCDTPTTEFREPGLRG
jgi:hypothetical protein